MKKRWTAAVLTVAMMISVIAPLSAYADDGDDVLFGDDYDCEEPYDGTDDAWDADVFEMVSDEAQIATQDLYTLDDLKILFPHGKYWNHVGSSQNNPMGWTDSPCLNHNSNGYNSSTCNHPTFGNYYGCWGYADQLGYLYGGSNPETWQKNTDPSALDSLKTGDIVRYRNNGHSILVTAVNGDTVTFTDCNWGEQRGSKWVSDCNIRWDVSITKSKLRETFSYVRVCPRNPVYPTGDLCSEAYAGWYYVSADKTQIHSGHNLSSYMRDAIQDQRIYVTKATGTGVGQLGYIMINGQECYIAMAGLTRMSGVQTAATMVYGDQIAGNISVSGVACDWKDLSRTTQVRIVADSGQEVTGTANQSGYNPLYRWSVVTQAEQSQGNNHGFALQLKGLPSGMRTLHIYVYSQEAGGWVEAETQRVDIATLTKLDMKTAPEKTEYAVGDTLDITGLVLKGTYQYKSIKFESDSEEERDITSGFTCTPTTLDTAGTQTITVSYDGASTSFDVTVKEKEKPVEPTEPTEPTEPDTPTTPTEPDQPTTPDTPDEKEDKLEKLEVETLTTKTTYVSGDTLDTTGLVLKTTYSVSGEKYITDGYRCSPSVVYVTGKREITVRYDGGETSFEIYVKEAPSNGNNNDTSTVKPGNNTSTTTPSDDGSGMAAAILLGGAVVVVGGIVMMAMAATPVEVRATAVTSDHAVLANEPITLLQGDRVVAQTVTDANGQFNFNVKKGSYTLRMTTTNAETGETVTRYAYISAPASGSVVTF